MTNFFLLDSLLLPPTTLRTVGSLVVTQGQSDFPLNFLIADFLKETAGNSNGSLIILSCTKGSRHLSEVGGRLGWSWKSLKDSGRLHVLDLLQDEWDRLSSGLEETDVLLNFDFNKIYEKMASLQASISSPSLIVLDDLSGLLYLSEGEERGLVKFLMKLKKFGKDHGATILASIKHPNPDEDVESSRFSTIVSQSLADVCIQVMPLSTGSSPNVTGHIRIRVKESVIAVPSTPSWSKLCQYKLDEKSVRVSFI